MTTEAGWTPPDSETRSELMTRYSKEGHLVIIDACYLTPESFAAAEAAGFPSPHTDVAPADCFRAACICGDGARQLFTDWTEARWWARYHRQYYGLDWQEFLHSMPVEAFEVRGHEIAIDRNPNAFDGAPGWSALCLCDWWSGDQRTFEEAKDLAAAHAAFHGGRWADGEPAQPEDYVR